MKKFKVYSGKVVIATMLYDHIWTVDMVYKELVDNMGFDSKITVVETTK